MRQGNYYWNEHFRRIGIDVYRMENDERYSHDDRALELDLLIRYMDGELDEENNAEDIEMIEQEFVAEPQMNGVNIPDLGAIVMCIDELAYEIYSDYML